ncbi:MAG: ATP-binding protein [Candidatus Sericytochromatia bacterium]
MYVLNLLNDFTKQKQIQEKLNNEKKNLKTLIETLPDLVWVKDLEGVYLYCNNKFEKFIGHKESEIIGKKDYELVEKELADFFRQNDKKALENNKSTINLEWLTFASDGHKELVQTIKTPLYDNSNKLIGVLGLGHDITELYETQEEIKRLNFDLEEKVKERTQLLEQANKDLEAFAYSVSHDLRAPLRHIDGFTNLLKVKLPLHNEESDKYIEKITSSSKKMSLMIDELLKFSRLGRKKIEKNILDLNIIIKQIIEQYKPDCADRKISFEVEELPEVLGDQILLQSVFENIISNAIKFTSKKEEAFIKIGLIKKDNKQIIYIKDNGAGFDMAYSDKLFSVFQRLHLESDFSGTGIGLANVKQIISKHGWNIHAESEVDKGATFYITLNP